MRRQSLSRYFGVPHLGDLVLVAAFGLWSVDHPLLSPPVQAQGSNVDRQGNDVDGNQSAGRLLPNADVITGVGCVLPQWLESESQRLDDIVVRLHKRQGLDLAGYQKESPADCPLQRFKYRVNVLGQLVAYMEKR